MWEIASSPVPYTEPGVAFEVQKGLGSVLMNQVGRGITLTAYIANCAADRVFFKTIEFRNRKGEKRWCVFIVLDQSRCEAQLPDAVFFVRPSWEEDIHLFLIDGAPQAVPQPA